MKTESPPNKIRFHADQSEAEFVSVPKKKIKSDKALIYYRYTKSHEPSCINSEFPMTMDQIEKLKSHNLLSII